MSQGLVERQNLEDIADAIRSKNGSSDTYTPAEMAQAISGIHTADEVVLMQKTVNANGQYNASDDSADGYSGVRVNVPNTYSASDEGKVVSGGALVGQTSRNISQNGTYDTTENNQVVVNVSGGGSGGNGNATAANRRPTVQDNDVDYWYVIGEQKVFDFTPSSNANTARSGGNVFTTSKEITVLALLFFARSTVFDVYLSNIDGTEIEHAHIANADANSWNIIQLENAITLQIGQYIIWGSNDSYSMKYSSSGSSKVDGIVRDKAMYASSYNTFPTQNESNTVYGVDIVVKSDVASEQWKRINGVWEQIA